MKIETVKVLEYLKPKVKALGFKKEILEGIAADIADNLEEVDDEASDEDVNAKIKPAVDAVIPSLKLAQRLTNQGIEEFRKKQEKANEQKPEEKKPEEKPEPKKPEEPSSIISKKEEKTEETPKWVKELIESNKAQIEQQNKLIETLQAEVNGIKSKTTTEKRRALLDELLKDTGTFGHRTIKSFEKMKFDSDAEFDEFVSDIKEDLEQLNQERANEGLSKFGVPKVEKKDEQPAKPKPLTDAEVEELAANM